MSGQIALRPSYWASVSGGKDSLYIKEAFGGTGKEVDDVCDSEH